MSEDFYKLLNENLNKELLPKEGSLIETEILQVNSDFVVVNVGAKQETLIPRKEFTTIPTVGSIIKVFVEHASTSQIKLSYIKALRSENIGVLQEKFDQKLPVEGVIKKAILNGFLVDLMGYEAFLPFSQVSTFGILKEEEKASYLQQKKSFIILKFENKPNRMTLLVSLKALLQDQQRSQTSDYLQNLKMGQILEGVIVKVNPYSLLVEVAPSVCGLVRISDVSWERIPSLSEKVSVGEKVSVKVINIDLEKKQMLLSIKDAQGKVWQEFIEKHPLDSVVEGTIQVIKEKFMIVRLEYGVKGLIHKSNISWTKSPSLLKEFKINDVIQAKIINIDEEKQSILLGIKQLKPNAWEEFAKSYSVGTSLVGKIVRKTDFAYFVENENQIPLMLHKNDLSWNTQEQNMNTYQIGDTVSCVVTKIDIENKKISCGMKNFEENPWKNFAQRHFVGSIIKGKVKTIENNAYVLILDENIETTLHFSHVPHNREFAVGDEIEVLLTDFNRYKKIIRVSIKALENKKSSTIVENYLKNNNDSESNTPTLGDIFTFETKK